ncbi:hypothetical protein [Protofrankia symbiont of Coriaria ruscifolia]|uniref:hypothetical protein n=1 Tax=Protofrankia symbiont of Coriaria ruscifolia TaxID=1306542 RepID=UPI001041489C|nr:hypothetical protein [Protofrankia symbiont of Coriaria ruscifolia]
MATSGGQPAADQGVRQPPAAVGVTKTAQPSSEISPPAEETVRTPSASPAGESGLAEEAGAVEAVEQAAPAAAPPAQDPVPAGTQTAAVEVPAGGTSVVAQAAGHAEAREPVAAEPPAAGGGQEPPVAGGDQELPVVAAVPSAAASASGAEVSGGEASGVEVPGGEASGDVSADSGSGENEIVGEHDMRVSPHPTPSVSHRRWWRRFRVRQGH